jgi:hypothetical protein
VNILDDIARDHPHLAALIHHEHPNQEPHPMTASDTAPAARQPSTLAQAVHSAILHIDTAKTSLEHQVAEIGAGIEHALPLLERIVSDPVLDEFVEAALRASNAGVPAELIQGATDMLRQAEARKTAPQAVITPPELAALSPEEVAAFEAKLATVTDPASGQPAPDAIVASPPGIPQTAPDAPEIPQA